MTLRNWLPRLGILAVVACTVAVLTAAPRGAIARFHADDPLAREPETQDASKVQPWDIDLIWDLTLNLFSNPGDPAIGVKARNINTIDEVPDSNWFTNRIGMRPVSVDEAVRGPLTDDVPAAGRWSVTRAKEAGVAPGFTMRDAKGQLWFVSFDAKGFPDAATGAILVANKIFWTLGYWQVENHLIRVRPEELDIGASAEVTPPSGKRRGMKRSDIDDVLRRAHRSADGSYRAVAARAVPGRVLGGFRYHGTRPDDPNDIVPHEHRRELRALKVFGAWTNLVDMKANNTLDTLITENGKSVVRHYLQDVGSTFGTGALGPHQYDEGWEYVWEGDLALKRLFTLGFYLQPWQTVPYGDNASIGRFEGAYFEPERWKPRVPTAAFRHARGDDNFWAARRVMAFSDGMIRAIAETGHYHDESAPRLLADILIQRRDRIAHAYLDAVNPVVNLALGLDGGLTFENAAVTAGVAAEPDQGYIVHWAAFDNTTGEATPLGPPTATRGRQAQAPAALPSSPGSFVKVQVAAASAEHPSWAVPVEAFFSRSAKGWTLVGLERLPARAAGGRQ
jgi:hypothetical protein